MIIKILSSWFQCIGELGTIVQMLFQGKSCRVQYMNGKIENINKAALTRVDHQLINQRTESTDLLREFISRTIRFLKQFLGTSLHPDLYFLTHYVTRWQFKCFVKLFVYIFLSIWLNIVKVPWLKRQACELQIMRKSNLYLLIPVHSMGSIGT